jgi:hypothetical protein
MFDALFQALFSYRPVVFQQGQFRFDVSGASLAAALLLPSLPLWLSSPTGGSRWRKRSCATRSS